MRWMPTTALLAATSLTACTLLQPPAPPAEPAAPDPNQSLIEPRGALAPVQQTAKTTLLEENEHLRDLLSRALAEKRELEKDLTEARSGAEDLTKQAAAQEETIAVLTERVGSLEQGLSGEKTRAEMLDKERKNLAELYAVEKLQRLAFEKELLEREIAERTHGREDG